MSAKNKKLLIIFGPPAVGKTRVGKIIELKSDFKLFHNHIDTTDVSPEEIASNILKHFNL